MFDSELFTSFAHVYIQDATHFSLPDVLSTAFPGSYSQFGKTATAKIQAIFCLTKGIFSGFQLNSFRDTDQKDASRIVDMLLKGDLVIRDLGYFTLSSFEKIIEKGSHFLSRFKYGVSVHEPDTGEPIHLLKYLKKYGCMDKLVILGEKTKVKCRMIAIKLPEHIASRRRRKAKQDRNQKTNHSKEYLELLGYAIMITTAGQDIWTPTDVVNAYRCRWYIEILFKGWKSGLKIHFDIPARYVTKERAEFFFYASLLMINLLVMPIFTYAMVSGLKQTRFISILKTCVLISQQLVRITHLKRLDKLLDQIMYHCAYEKRQDRTNSIEQMFFLVP